MNLPSLLRFKSFRRRGMALVIVIGALALATMLLLAMFSLTESEYRSTQNYVSSLSAKQFNDGAVAVVQSQLLRGSFVANQMGVPSNSAADRTIHATQPGMIRVYHPSGAFKEAYRLYSSAQMFVQGPETSVFNPDGMAPNNWATMPARFVDLNEPVVRPSLGDGVVGGGGVSLYFPIIDPRAAFNFIPGGEQYHPKKLAPAGAQTTQVEGFWFDKNTTGSGSSVSYDTVMNPLDVGGNDEQLRLPMPVEWIYVLQDGSMGTLNDNNTFVGAAPPDANNPIVARIAFWTDDESCKININTASEPTFMAPPFYYHMRDAKWANFPASASEYQRYPGHPATVALSTVLAPNYRLDPYRPTDDGLTDAFSVAQIKEQIYNLAPKVSMGGSLAGTVPFVTDDFSLFNNETAGPSQMVNTAVARAERLYASVDEMLFRDGEYLPNVNGGSRVPAVINFPGVQRVMFDHDTLERTRFFLTAHSRAPEFSMYGLPRVCMWPVADGEQQNNIKRTNFDNLIALCATLRGNTSGTSVDRSYFFRRAEAHHSTYDVTGTSSGYGSSQGLQRNSKLLDYLVNQMAGMTWPQIGAVGGSSPNYERKYGIDNVRQLAVQFFDYVRCTNLYDGVLARGQDGMLGSGKSSTALYLARDTIANQKLTYTDHRITPAATNVNADARSKLVQEAANDSGTMPGHGQVTPAVWEKGGQKYMGFGRMFTLSEVGVHFICTADGLNDEYAVDFEGVKSGGGTAWRTDPQLDSKDNPKGAYQPFYQPNNTVYPGYTLIRPPSVGDEAVWWSNFPPLGPNSYPTPGTPGPPKPTLYGTKTDVPSGQWHPVRHPGYNPDFWNLTLAQDTPLQSDEKRIQGIFLMEAFCPMLGWTAFHPEYTIVVDGNWIGQIKVNGKRPFDTTGDIVVKSNQNLFEVNTNVHASGGHAGPTAMSGNRGGRPVSGEGIVLMGSDTNWISGNTSGHNALTNYGLTSNFMTVKRNQPLSIEFPTGALEIHIYDKHDGHNLNLQPVQRIAIRFPSATTKTPALVYNNYPRTEPLIDSEGMGAPTGRQLNYYTEVDKFGNIKYRRATQAPHWWCFNSSGCLGRVTGRVNPAYSDATASDQPFWLSNPAPYPPGAANSPLRHMLKGRLDVVSSGAIPGGWTPPGSPIALSILPPEAAGFESDIIRTMVPGVGDYRMIAARHIVPPELWVPHPEWTPSNRERSIHTFSGHWGHTEPGFNLPPGLDGKLLVGGVAFGSTSNLNDASRTPDLPGHPEWGRAANSFGDFDTGISNAREGPYINKPDEGNFFAGTFTRNSITKFYRSGYFYESWRNSDDWRSGIYMTPNRMVSSPVMFGSLPTGVWGDGGSQNQTALTGTSLTGIPARPWQTLLFRPYVQSNLPAYGSKTNHPGDAGPKDHFLLDMFFMPVVEPYAISEPLSVAGRINMNYQIMPFTNIKRATGMHALMKGEFITAIPNGDLANSKNFKSSPNTQLVWDVHFDEKTSPRKFWHRRINVDETLVQFEERFNMNVGSGGNGLFRSASQICEVHLIPDVSTGVSEQSGEFNPTLVGIKTPAARALAMKTFWQNHAATGDNIRERPYSNLYSRITTRSNTFRVHVRAQVLKKARSAAPDIFDPNRDAVLSEYRGSTLLERYIDPNDPANALPDYANTNNPVGQNRLDSYYQFRVIETKRFNP